MAATWAEICWFTIPSSKPAMVWPVLIIDKDLKMCTICVYICIYIYIYVCIYISICVCVDRTKVISHIQYYMLGRSIDGWIGGSMDRRLDGSIDIYLWPVAGSSQVGTRGHKCTNHKDLGSKDYSADMRIWMGIHVWIRFFMWGICIYIYTYIHNHTYTWVGVCACGDVYGMGASIWKNEPWCHGAVLYAPPLRARHRSSDDMLLGILLILPENGDRVKVHRFQGLSHAPMKCPMLEMIWMTGSCTSFNNGLV